MEELLEQFERLATPSRSDEPRTIPAKDISRILSEWEVWGEAKSPPIQRVRKLREVALASDCCQELTVRLLTFSALHALRLLEYGEFWICANRLLEHEDLADIRRDMLLVRLVVMGSCDVSNVLKSNVTLWGILADHATCNFSRLITVINSVAVPPFREDLKRRLRIRMEQIFEVSHRPPGSAEVLISRLCE